LLATVVRCLVVVLTVPLGPRLAAAQEPASAGGPGEQWGVRAEVEVVRGKQDRPDTAAVLAVLTNEGPTAAEVEHGACPVRLHAFRTESREGAPVWRSENRAPWEGGYEYACPLYLAMREVAAGEEYSPDEFSLSIPVTEILADSLPDGQYHFTVFVDAASTTFQLPAGDAELRLKRPPLRDVAGMLRSFHYASYAAVITQQMGGQIRDEDIQHLKPWMRYWYAWVAGSYLKGYLSTARNSAIVPKSGGDLHLLLDVHLIEKAIYELGYELNNRPTWVGIPLQGIHDLIRSEGS
jgi:hypothetical protein